MGGCCRTYAADISRIRNEVTKWQQKQANIAKNEQVIPNGDRP